MADKLGNAGALGLCAFGVSTLCMMLINSKTITDDKGMAVILGAGIFYGGLVQLLVGLQEWKAGDTFGTVAFTSYGAFWLSHCAILLYGRVFGEIISPKAIGIYMLAWTLLTIMLFIATLKLVPVLTVIFGTATIAFILLTAGGLAGSEMANHAAAFVGVLLGLEALYGGVAQVINEVYGKEILPIGAECKTQ